MASRHPSTGGGKKNQKKEPPALVFLKLCYTVYVDNYVTSNNSGVAQLLSGVAMMPDVIRMLTELQNQVSALQRKLMEKDSRSEKSDADGWYDTKRARKYLSDMSEDTFNKYQHSTDVKLKGHKLDGKTYFYKADLDNFMRLYDLKSNGLA